MTSKKQSIAAPSASGEQTPLEESLDPPAFDVSQENTPMPIEQVPDAFSTLKAMIEAQYEEIKLLRNQTLDATKAQPPRSTESEAKDLLRKIKFNGKHFSSFKIKFQNICQLRHIWDVIQGTENLPDAPSEAQTLEYEDKVNLAKSYLQTSLSNEVFDMVREDETPAEMWNTLIANYKTKEWSNTIYVLRRLCQLRYEPKADMLKHISKVRSTIRELNDMGKSITEQGTVEWILISLPDSGPENFNAFINHLKPTPQQEVRLKTLISALLNEEEKRSERARMRRNDRGKPVDFKRPRLEVMRETPGMTNEINALQSRLNTSQPKKPAGTDEKWCFICRKRGDHVAQDHPDFDPNHGKSNQRHTSKFLRAKKRKELSDRSDSASDDEATYDINAIAQGNGKPEKETHWTLDNCATGHVTGQKGVINSWEGTAQLVLPNQTNIQGQVGTVKLHLLRDGECSTLTLRNVTYEPSLYKNLISHVRLLEYGYKLTKQDMGGTIYKNDTTQHELCFKMINNLYVLSGVEDTTIHAIAMVSASSPNLDNNGTSNNNTGLPIDELKGNDRTQAQDETRGRSKGSDEKLLAWHNKLNHADMNQVAKIIKPIMIPGVDAATTQQVCSGCAQGQAKRMSFRNTHHYVAPRPLESLNGDLCGPIRPQTINHETYTSMFVDQASRYIFGQLLRTKADAILHLNEITTKLDNQLPDSRISNLYTDGGGEYASSTFKAACHSRGITQKFTNAETPEENHLAEKTNEYVFNKIRVYMTLCGLPSTLWGYCFKYVVHVYNNTPQELLNQRTPYEVLYSKPSRLYMLKTFGCMAYKFIPKSHRPTKLTNPAIPCVFLGYAEDQLGYKLWDPKSRTVTVSRSVKFDETKLHNASMFANDEFSHGRLSIPNYVKFKDISSHEDLTLRRFAEPTSELTNAIIASSAKVETGGQEAKLRPTRAIKRPKRFEVNLVTTHAIDSRPRISEPLTMQDMRSSVEVEQ
ncbi:hypothetical protein AeNC1_015563 [Aphanomyces euteiches]|nr:hypothetical protein AeNC1_015563 [Aphanomyces euteiches]